MSKLTGNF